MNLLLTTNDDLARRVLEFMLASSLRSGLIILVAYLVTRLWRGSSAALRQWVWVVALSGVLLLPAVSLVSPAWRLSVLPGIAPTGITKTLFGALPVKSPGGGLLPVKSITGAQAVPPINQADFSSVVAAKTDPGSAPVKPAPQNTLPSLSGFALLIALWAVGAAFILIRWSRQWQAIRRITRRGTTITDDKWQSLSRYLSGQAGVNRAVRLVLSDQVAVPMTWGLQPAIILLPCEALGWSTARRRVVLLHELAHVARHDYLTQWLTLITCALNWFNPLIWFAARQSALEREQASDDAVLNAGIDNSDYAGHLLAIARVACQQRRLYGAIGLAFARRSALTGRVHHILRPLPNRRDLPGGHRLALLGMIGLLILPLATVQFGRATAQQPIVLTIALPMYMKDTFNDHILKDFQAANPGIQVSVTDSQQIPEAAFGLQMQLDALQKYASSADVLFIADQFEPQISPQATRAGYFLDLSPLVNADPSLNASDFVPAIWRSYQWDNGIWAIPFGANAQLIDYDPAAFDKAKVPYPTDSWTAAEFLDAVTKLTIKDAQGHIITLGFATTGGFSREIMMRALSGGELFDTNSVPNPPALDQPGVEAAVTAFSQMQNQGLIGDGTDETPMSIIPAAFFSADRGTSGRSAALLPGGSLYLQTQGFAISAGTQHVDAAYALLKFISQRQELAGSTEIPARLSLAGSQLQLMPAAIQALLNRGLAHALTTADMRFADYLRIADNNIGTGSNTDAQNAIQNEQTQATIDANAALAKKGTLALSVNEPAPVVLAPGKIMLNFDLSANVNPLPTQEQWNRFIQDFAAKDPVVGSVNLTVSQHYVGQAASHSDCFYLDQNAVQNLSESTVLNLDPYLNADSTFDKSDLLGSVLPAVQRDNKTWAFPLTLEPMVMVYDADKFNRAGLPSPSNGWTIESFIDALQHLKVTNPTDPTTTPPFVASGDGVALLTLIADYGGVPIDYRTSPPTINFTDPANVTAIQQVLDLAKNGEISYGSLGNLFGGRGGPNWNQTSAMFNINLTNLNFISGSPKGRALMFNNSQTALFPSGHTYTGVAYDLGTAYISATAQNPDACYRFIRALSDHPELFWNMPVRQSTLASASYKSLTSASTLALYNRIAAQLADPHTLPFPMSAESGAESFSILFPQHWLFEAFDAYVLNHADLASALNTADQQSKGYLGCIANLPPLNLGDLSASAISAAHPFAACAETMEPALKAQLEPLFAGLS